MNIDPEDIKHWVQQAPVVLFGARQELDEDRFLRAVDFLLERAERGDTDANRNDHWRAIERRLRGRDRWDAIVPRFAGDFSTGENIRKHIDSQHSAANILKHRPYTAATINGLQFVLDVFDPAGELGIPYKDAGEPVLALLMKGTTRLATHDELTSNEPFYEVIAGLDAIVDAHHVIGNFSMVNTMMAYNDGSLSPMLSIWDLLYQLVTVQAIDAPPRAVLEGLFERVDAFPGNRLLLQLTKGFDFIVRDKYAVAANLLHLTYPSPD
jgi:hypothetical protein